MWRDPMVSETPQKVAIVPVLNIIVTGLFCKV